MGYNPHIVELDNGLTFEFTLTPESLRVQERTTGLDESMENPTGELGTIGTIAGDNELIVTLNGEEIFTIMTAKFALCPEHGLEPLGDFDSMEDMLLAGLLNEMPLSRRQLRKLRDMIDAKLADEPDDDDD